MLILHFTKNILMRLGDDNMFLWYDSWEQVKELLTDKIRAGMSFDDTLIDIRDNHSELYNLFFKNVRMNPEEFLNYALFLPIRRL